MLPATPKMLLNLSAQLLGNAFSLRRGAFPGSAGAGQGNAGAPVRARGQRESRPGWEQGWGSSLSPAAAGSVMEYKDGNKPDTLFIHFLAVMR